ncbi:scc-3 [Pristionchus pacificus]|uniref:Scc-3 n=1 Tax=Pristionchus pacificus TaxID=54126 RepID=A0A2A6CFR3_PRIPA|nr:scc-3 [Pristionchus pacificus]|eukprot:PDM76928.1 scc-3 [Pristionchus pacificus]
MNEFEFEILVELDRDAWATRREMDSGPSDQMTPRMATRGGPRVNYAELNQSGGNSQMKTKACFALPPQSRRGRPRGGVGRPRGGGRKAGTFPGDTEERGLFGAVRNGRTLEATFDEWVSSYETYPDAAIHSLLQFFIYSCGCKGTLERNLYNADFPKIVRQLTEGFDEESGDYPIVMTGQHYKKFRQNFSDGIHLLVNKCKASIIHDGQMMDKLVQLLIALTDSQARAFRHTATFAALKLSSALVDVAVELNEQQEKIKKLIEAEKSKMKQQKSTGEKMDELMRMKGDIEEKSEEIKQILSYIFKSVFVHRYRDVVPDIRSVCISELGVWILVYPHYFLEDSYLKYIGWSLHDKVPDVRHKCISALVPLYTRPDTAGKLELFTHKFKERLVSMVMDKDNDVAIQSCHLMTNIYRVFPTLLTVKDCIPIYEQVYANHGGLARAAAEFLNCKVFQQGDDSIENQYKLIKDLVTFFQEGEVHDHAAYLVDALIESNRMMKEWQIMVDLLLLDDQLEESSEGHLIEIMVCAARQATSGEFPVGRLVVKRGAPAVVKELRLLKEEKKRLSAVFIPVIAQLLHKFMADREKVANLMTIPSFFALDAYTSANGEKHLKELLEAIRTVMERHADDEIMSTATEVLALLGTNTLTAQISEPFSIALIDTVMLQLRTAATSFAGDATQGDEEDEAQLLSAFRKIAALLTNMDVRRPELWDIVLPVVTAITDGKHAATEILELSMNVLSLCLEYDLHRTIEEGGKADAIKKLKKRRDQFIVVGETVMQTMASGVETTFKCIVDVLVTFSSFDDHSDSIRQLTYSVSKDLASKLRRFVDDNVFGSHEDTSSLDQTSEIEMMHRKRSLLAQYCKLALHGVIPYLEAAHMLRHYVKFYSDFGDILKLLILKTRDTDRMANARMLSAALKLAYEDVKAETGGYVDPDGDVFSDLRDMAKRFAQSIGHDYEKSRDPLAVIHRDGIMFALEEGDPTIAPSSRRGAKRSSTAPPNLSYLEVIYEFSHKLIRQDKQAVYNYLEKKVSTMDVPPTAENQWQSYILYKNSLTERVADDNMSIISSAVSNFSLLTTPRGGRGRGRPRGSIAGSRMMTPMSEI